MPISLAQYYIKYKIREYCTRNTRVLHLNYSSTAPELLEYYTRNTPVLHPNYSTTAPQLLNYCIQIA